MYMLRPKSYSYRHDRFKSPKSYPYRHKHDRYTVHLIAAAYNPTHPFHPLTNHQLPPRYKKHTLTLHFNHLYNQIPLCQPILVQPNTHMQITHQTVNSLPPYTILNTSPLKINTFESTHLEKHMSRCHTSVLASKSLQVYIHKSFSILTDILLHKRQ